MKYALKTDNDLSIKGTDWVVAKSGPTDLQSIAQYYKRLSDNTLRMRFHYVVKDVPLKFISHYANRGDTSIQGLILKSKDGYIAGEALVCESNTLHQADLGVSVLDSHCSRGIGTALIKRSIEIARVCGFRQLVADTLWENKRFIRLLKHQGFATHKHSGYGAQLRMIFDL
jgi:L-amino acid N-acyltransferase YncA